MIKVIWPSNVATQAQVWRILDLSGMTRNTRESYNVVRAGLVFLNGSQVVGLSTTVTIGTVFNLQIRNPNGLTKSQDILVEAVVRIGKPRSNKPFTTNYRS